MAEIHIARVEVADDEVAAAWRLLMPQLSAVAPAPTRDELAALVATPGYALLIARDAPAAGIVGALSLTVYRIPTGAQARIDDVVVDERARGRGVGEALSRAAIALARTAGARSLGLTSHPRRLAANRLYQRLGFERRDTNVYTLQL